MDMQFLHFMLHFLVILVLAFAVNVAVDGITKIEKLKEITDELRVFVDDAYKRAHRED